MPKRNMKNGMKFGFLIVIDAYKSKNRSKRSLHLCLCECGSEKLVDGSHLMRGGVKSCGCKKSELLRKVKIKHGGHGTRTYRIWKGMRQRCNNKNDKSYPRYGGAGIKICDEWDDYAVFLVDMGGCPAGLTIDRIDGADGYNKDNCRWTGYIEQSRNRKARGIIPYAGIRVLPSGRYAVSICANYKNHYIGSTCDLSDAINMRLDAEDLHWGNKR